MTLQHMAPSRQSVAAASVPSNPSPIKALLIDDDLTTRDQVANYLEDRSMHVVAVSSLPEIMRQLAARQQSLIILNLGPRREASLDLLRVIRSRSDVPVIVTVGPDCREIDVVAAFELGADDCMTRPFGLRELIARMHAILRGWEVGLAQAPRKPERGCYRFGGWQLNRRTRRLLNPNGAIATLTRCEYALLIAFLDAPQRPLTREHLLRATQLREDVFDRSIDVRILRLRRKLEIDPSSPGIIRTERGVGYVFELPVERHSNRFEESQSSGAVSPHASSGNDWSRFGDHNLDIDLTVTKSTPLNCGCPCRPAYR
jgi:DNA-binding response OmpR family regulator